MAQKDIAEKTLESYNDVFADIINVLLFNGEKIVKEDELESDTTNSMFKVDGKLHEQNRDVSKIWKDGEIHISIIGFENQTCPDIDMPLRVLSYDGASYKQQLLNYSSKKRVPVITLVLYFGEKHWNKPITLLESLNIPKELESFVSDYKINVFEIAWFDDITIEKFTSDFKIVAKYFQTKRLKKDYEGSEEIIKHVDETLKMLSAITGDNSFERVYNKDIILKKGDVNMCEMIQKIRDEGKEEIIFKMLESKKITAEQISDILQLPIEKIKEIAKKIPVSK